MLQMDGMKYRLTDHMQQCGTPNRKPHCMIEDAKWTVQTLLTKLTRSAQDTLQPYHREVKYYPIYCPVQYIVCKWN